jgi:Leucine-rich repeat (LRR) protein
VASPTSGYRFVNWTGNAGTIANVNAATTTITVNGDYSVTANFEEEEAVTFPDANLEAAIREAIGKPTGPICPSGLDGLTSLSASARSITDLTGLEHCTSLTNLLLQHNQISNISPLANLTSLTWLRLHSNQISDIEPLVNNTGLAQGDTVNLTINPLSDTSINTYIPRLQARGVTVYY